jgi:uncharacterized membrane protein
MAGATDIGTDHLGASEMLVVAGDLVAVTGYAIVAGAAILTGVVSGPARVLITAPLVGLTPGYAVVSLLFPARRESEHGRWSGRWNRGPTGVERLSLAVGTSLVVVVLSAIGLSLGGVALQTTEVTTTVVALTTVLALAGVARRQRLPADERFAVPVSALFDRVRAGTVDAPPVDAALNVALAIAVMVAASTLAVGFAAPDRGDAYTEVALVTAEGDQLVASNYTTTVQRGDSVTTTLTVENQEGEPMAYTAVVVLERLETDGEETVLLEREELDRVDVDAADGETVREDLSVQPTMLGEDLRLNVYVYEDDAPGSASGETAPYHLYIWLDVERPDGSTERVTDAPKRGAWTAGT